MRHDRLALPGRGRFYGRERAYSSFFSFHCAQLPRFLEATGERHDCFVAPGHCGRICFLSLHSVASESDDSLWLFDDNTSWNRRCVKGCCFNVVTGLLSLNFTSNNRAKKISSLTISTFIYILKYDREMWCPSRSTRCCTGVINHTNCKFYSTVDSSDFNGRNE